MSVYLSHVEKRETTTSSGDADLFSALLTEFFSGWLLLWGIKTTPQENQQNVVKDSSKNSVWSQNEAGKLTVTNLLPDAGIFHLYFRGCFFVFFYGHFDNLIYNEMYWE